MCVIPCLWEKKVDDGWLERVTLSLLVTELCAFGSSIFQWICEACWFLFKSTKLRPHICQLLCIILYNKKIFRIIISRKNATCNILIDITCLIDELINLTRRSKGRNTEESNLKPERSLIKNRNRRTEMWNEESENNLKKVIKKNSFTWFHSSINNVT